MPSQTAPITPELLIGLSIAIHADTGTYRLLAQGKTALICLAIRAGVVTEEEQQEARAQLTTQRRRRSKSRKVYYKAGEESGGSLGLNHASK